MNFSPGTTSGQEGVECLRTVEKLSPDTKVIFMTAYGGVETAVKAIKEGASDFVVKPWDNQKLVATVGATLRFSQAAQTVKDLETRQRELSRYIGAPDVEIVGGSPAIERLLGDIQKIARTDASVLILGENGTGKELVARAIHRASARAGNPFVHVDLGAVPETLFESELFGHKKGAFTDAKEDRAGTLRDRRRRHAVPRRDRQPHVAAAGEAARRAANRARSRASAPTSRCRWTRASCPRPTWRGTICSTGSNSGRTCCTGSTRSRSTCRRCASARTTSAC